MLGVVEGNELRLYRRLDGRLTYWTTVRGSSEELQAALRTAQELTGMALELGGWANALGLGLYPAKPVHASRIPPRILHQDELDGGLRVL
jgi:hypothetical protein